MKILVADDHVVLRRGLIEILAEEFPDAEFGEAGTTQETLDRLGETDWTLLVLDLSMPGRSGFDVLSETRQRRPPLPVLVLSQAPEEQLAVRALKAGASGYLNKQAATEQLVRAVRTVLAGDQYVSPRLAALLASQLRLADRPTRHELLSDREYEVMCRIVRGKSLQEIATEFSLSPKTISTFHTRLWEKLGVHNDVELVHYALEHGLLEAAARPGSPPPGDPAGPQS
jgi:two-component system, NarL family, invasion response regulator UvrY